MGMKVSTSMFFDNASTQLGNIQGNLAKTQEQLSTGKQITKPSDQPDKASLITRLESELARQASYQGNLTFEFCCGDAHTKAPLTSAIEAGSNNGQPVISASMRFTMPAKTLPGPHSTTVLMPRALMACTHSTQRTGPKACR